MVEMIANSREAMTEITREQPIGRLGRAEEIANTIVWLLSEEASFISGVTVDVSGGGFVFGKR